MLVDYYLQILHFDRRMPLNIDLGPLHIHLYARAVFFMWVTVAILVIGGIAVLVSRKRELIQKWTTWLLIAPVVGIPVWIGRAHRCVSRCVGGGRGDGVCAPGKAEQSRHVSVTGVSVLYPLAAWLRPSLLGLAPIVVLAAALPVGAQRRRRTWRQAHRIHRLSVRCGSVGPWPTW